MWSRAVRLRMSCFISAGLSLLFFGFGALLLRRPSDGSASAGGLRVESRVRSLGDLPRGVETPVTFTVANQSPKSVRLLGASQFCTSWGCVYAPDFPVTVAPNSSGTFSLIVRTRPRSPYGNFTGDVTLYSDAPNCGRTPLVITGNIVRSAEQ